jgi:hypothetical protein
MITSGNALQRRGATFFQANANLAVGNTTIVSGAANVNGLIVRSAHLIGTNNAEVQIRDLSGQVYFHAGAGTHAVYNGGGILFPPAQAFIISSSSAGGFATVTYDTL